MPSWEEIVRLWDALRSNVLGFWGGILGLVFTAIWIFWEKAPMRRVFLTFFMLIFFLSFVWVWLDEYRDHKKDQELYQKSHRAWEAAITSLQAKLKEEPKVIYRDRVLPSRQESSIVYPRLQIIETELRPQGLTKIVQIVIKNVGNDSASGKVDFSMVIGGTKKKPQPITTALAPSVSRGISVSLEDKEFDSVADGKSKLELFVSIDYEGVDAKRYVYFYHAIYDHLAKQFNIIEEKWP